MEQDLDYQASGSGENFSTRRMDSSSGPGYYQTIMACAFVVCEKRTFLFFSKSICRVVHNQKEVLETGANV